ncbi:MAG: glycosyltransferase [Gammaproteobacteria bacterium]|jgi:glycosyltransferase involved in cell wall biosynthesis|nr:glycosyltransferase [Gammaproteobacteria bacterium]
MDHFSPRVSIGLPVYNGERFVGAALDSICNQTFDDFELIISDNASRDRTQEICERYAEKDGRIRYFRNEANIGAGNNFNRVYDLSKGTYFKWMAHDDVLAPTFLRECVSVLDKDETAVLSHPKASIIDENGERLKEYGVVLKTDAAAAHRRFAEIVLSRHNCYQVFGLIRSGLLGRTQLIGNYTGSDRNLLAELSLLGIFVEVPDVLVFYRHHPGRSMSLYPDRRERNAWFDPGLKGAVSFPTWRRAAEYSKSIKRSSLSPADRALCYTYLMRWITLRSSEGSRNFKLLAQDVVWALSRKMFKKKSV